MENAGQKENPEYLECGSGQRTAFQRRVSSAEHDPVFLSVGRYNLSVSVS